MVVNKLVHHLDTLVHFPACTLLGNYEVSKGGNSWKLIHFEMCVLSAEEQSKLFIEKAGDHRFRMMLLFLAGITGLQDTQVYQQILLKSYHQLQEQKLQREQQQELKQEEKRQLQLLEQHEQKQAHEEKRQRKLQNNYNY